MAINMMVKQYFPKYGIQHLAEEVAEGVWSSECLKGIARDHLMTLVKWCLRETVFSPQNVVRALDLFDGMLNFQGFHVL